MDVQDFRMEISAIQLLCSDNDFTMFPQLKKPTLTPLAICFFLWPNQIQISCPYKLKLQLHQNRRCNKTSRVVQRLHSGGGGVINRIQCVMSKHVFQCVAACRQIAEKRDVQVTARPRLHWPAGSTSGGGQSDLRQNVFITWLLLQMSSVISV